MRNAGGQDCSYGERSDRWVASQKEGPCEVIEKGGASGPHCKEPERKNLMAGLQIRGDLQKEKT